MQAGRAVFALDLDSALVGTLELHAYALLSGGGNATDSFARGAPSGRALPLPQDCSWAASTSETGTRMGSTNQRTRGFEVQASACAPDTCLDFIDMISQNLFARLVLTLRAFAIGVLATRMR